jgi:predicted permease
MRSAGLLCQDLRVSLRILAKNPGATVLSVISIAFGIAFSTAAFSLADAAFFRPFPFDRPEDVLQVQSLGDDGGQISYGWADYEDIARAGGNIATFAAYERVGAMLAGEDESHQVLMYPVTANYFDFLGVRAAFGRASVDLVEHQPTVVLSSRLWRSRFASDPAIVGKTIRLNNRQFLVAGVLPPEFTGMMRGVANDVWISTDAYFDGPGSASQKRERCCQFEIVARLNPGVTQQRAAMQLDAAIRGPGKHKPAPRGSVGTRLAQRYGVTLKQKLAGGAAMLPLLGLILFIGCANAAQLRIAQAEARKVELTIRRALGAGTWSVTRLLLADAALICIVGAGLGLLMTEWLLGTFNQSLSMVMPILDSGARLDHRVVLMAIIAAAAAVLFAGIVPVRYAIRQDIGEVLKRAQRAGGAVTEWRRRALVGVQIAVTVLFFGMAVQLVENVRNASRVRPGFDPNKKMLVVSAWSWPAGERYERDSERLTSIPGVRAATFARRLHLSGIGDGATARVEIPGQAPLGVRLNQVAGNYFSVMGTRLLAGRGIEPADHAGSPLMAVVSSLFVKDVLGGRDPIGQWISIDGMKRQVVGVAEDGPVGEPNLHEQSAPYLYLPFAQAPSGDVTLLIETFGEPEQVARAVRSELKRFDPGLTIISSTTLRRHMDAALFLDRAAASVGTGMGVIGFLLTAAGLFGVIQFAVRRRTRELGLRIALGAQRVDIQRLVVGEALRISAWGIPVGLLLLGFSARAAQSLLLGVAALDPLTYALSSAAAVAIALAASCAPALRAGRVDPMEALRTD